MRPQITLHYRLSDAKQRALVAAGKPARRQLTVTIAWDDANAEMWQRFAALLPWDDDGVVELAAATLAVVPGSAARLDGFPDADEVLEADAAAAALFAYLEPSARRAEEAQALRQGRWPDSAPVGLAELLPAGPDAAIAALFINCKDTVPLVDEADLVCEIVGLAGLEVVWVPFGHGERTAADLLAAGTTRSLAALREAYRRFGGEVAIHASECEVEPLLQVTLDSPALIEEVRRRIAAEPPLVDAHGGALEQDLAEAAAWIAEHGSRRLQRILKLGLLDDSWAVYEDERLAVERPGWCWAWIDIDGELVELDVCAEPARDVTDEALDLLESVEEDPKVVDGQLVFLRLPVYDEGDLCGYAVLAEYRDTPICRFDAHLAAAIAECDAVTLQPGLLPP